MQSYKYHSILILIIVFLSGCEGFNEINNIGKDQLREASDKIMTLDIPEVPHPSERESGRIYGWGDNDALNYIPEGDDFVEVSAGVHLARAFALKSDGTPVLIGDDGWGERGFDEHVWQDEADCNDPQHGHKPRYLSVTPHLGLREDSTLVSWHGEFQVSQSSGFVAISGYTALHEDGSVSVLGMPAESFSPPSGNDYVAISQGGGGTYLLLLDKNGVVHIYGDDYGDGHAYHDNRLSDSEERFTTISAGLDHQVAIDDDGKITTWGDNTYNQHDHPDTDGWQQVAAGHTHSAVLNDEGRIMAWGSNDKVVNYPTESGFIMISAGNNYTLGIR